MGDEIKYASLCIDCIHKDICAVAGRVKKCEDDIMKGLSTTSDAKASPMHIACKSRRVIRLLNDCEMVYICQALNLYCEFGIRFLSNEEAQKLRFEINKIKDLLYDFTEGYYHTKLYD